MAEVPEGGETLGTATPWISHTVTALKDAAGLLVVVGGILYTVLNSSYRAFYGEFGLTPRDVGLGQPEIVAHAVGALIFYAAIAVIVAAACLLVAVAVTWRTKATLPRAAALAFVVASLTIPVALGMTLTPVVLAKPFRPWTGLAVTCLISLSLIGGLLNNGKSWRYQAVAGLIGLSALAVLYLTAPEFSAIRGDQLAQQVLNGDPVPAVGLTAAFEVGAPVACVSGTADGKQATIRMFMLGQSDGRALFFFDPSARATVIVPSASVRISLPQNGECQG